MITSIKVKRMPIISLVNLILFSIMVFIKAFGDAQLAANKSLGIIDDLKYLLLIVSAFFCILSAIRYGKLNGSFIDDFKRYLAVVFIFFFISVIFSVNVKVPRIMSIKYWIYFVLPFIYSWGLINTINSKTLVKYFKIAFIITFSCYVLFEKGLDIFNASNFSNIYFSESWSPFESEYAAGSSIAMCAFFCYFREDNKIWTYLSLIFCFLTFKRAAIIMMFIYFFLPIIKNKDYNLKKYTPMVWTVLFIVLTVSMAWLFDGNNIKIINNVFGIDFNKLFMGRIRLYNELLNTNYTIAGFGTTLDVMGYYFNKSSGIEMELIQILLEVSIIGLIPFVRFVILLAKRNLYCFSISVFMLFNMLTSSSISSPFTWIFTYLTIWGILKNQKINNTTGSGELG